LNVIREEYSAVTHAKIESLRKLGLDTAEGLAKNKGKHFGREHLGELFAQPIVSRDWFGLLQRSVRHETCARGPRATMQSIAQAHFVNFDIDLKQYA
jgi:hypothetical protein